MKVISTMLAFGVAVLGATPWQSISKETTAEIPTQTGKNPCALLSACSASYESASPEESSICYRPSRIQACMRDVPINNTLAVEQIKWIQEFVQFQSTLAYLKDPPPGYALPAIDVVGRLDEIAAKAKAEQYHGEYEFEVDIADVFARTCDGHLNYSPFLTSGISYNSNQQVVSLSLDGQELPKIYVLSDITAKYSEFANFTPSALVTVNGQSVQNYLAQTGYLTAYQDLDAQYNAQFPNPATDLFNTASFMSYSANANDTNSFVFENGTITTTRADAAFVSPLAVLGSGQAIFNKYVTNNSVSPTSSTASPTSTSTPLHTSLGNSSDLAPPGLGFPVPIMKDSANYVSGYFLKDNPEVAVLVISSFGDSTQDTAGIQKNIANFLVDCKKNNKKKLIIDTRGNNGGFSYLAYDTFKQLFPSKVPYSGDRLRLSKAASIMANVATQVDPNTDNPLSGSFFDALSNLKSPDGPHFQSYGQLFDPIEIHGDIFSHVAAEDFGNADIDESSAGIVVSGYANDTNNSSQVFRGEDIILLSDGVCPSTCAIFANLLINQGNVRTAAIGGRPNTKPMAVIGGVQGTLVLHYNDLRIYVNATLDYLHNPGTVTTLDKAASIAILSPIIAPPPLNYFPGESSVGVNLLDSIAANDTTQTPLQFTRSPNAECRFFYMPRDLLSVEYTWTRIAKGFRNNGKGLCIGGAAGFSPMNKTLGGSMAAVSGSSSSPTRTGIAKGFQNNGNGLCIDCDDGFSPMNRTGGGTTATVSRSTSGPTRTFSPILPFNGGLSVKYDNQVTIIIAVSAVYLVLFIFSS